MLALALSVFLLGPPDPLDDPAFRDCVTNCDIDQALANAWAWQWYNESGKTEADWNTLETWLGQNVIDHHTCVMGCLPHDP